MPKVETRKKSVRGEYSCDKCGKPIMPGEEYFTWSFRYGGTHRRHIACGRPKQSELTQSRMSEIYAAQEALEAIDSDSWEDKASAMRDLATVTEEVMEAYREAAENFGGGGENAERADQLEGWASELDEAATKLEEIAEALGEAESAMEVAGNCPI